MNVSADGILKDFLVELKRKYGTVVCDLQLEDKDGKYMLFGKVLHPRLVQDLQKRFDNAHVAVDVHVSAITDVLEPPLGFAYPDRVPTNVWRRVMKKDLPRFLSTQINVKEDPIKLLWETDEYYCVQLIDQTIGWVHKSELTRINGFPHWTSLIQKACSNHDFDMYLERWLGVPYVWGGTTVSGVDCSGLMQNIYRRCFNYLLPKHSLDQRNIGNLTLEPKKGDLAFFRFTDVDRKTIGHVGIVIDAGGKKVLHASFSQRKVVINTVSEIMRPGYEFLGFYHYPVEIL